MANGSKGLIEEIVKCYNNNAEMDPVLHEKAMDLYRLYLCVGGMPEAIKSLINNDKHIMK